MRTDIFSPGESILLVGEGNFSFAVGLVNLDLSLEIVATCMEHEVISDVAKSNVLYLKQKGVTVFQGVDATKLADHAAFKSVKYSKIIFNFPHVGGKMKIHLNRQLLKLFFQSSSELLKPNGTIVVSLCRGQGGTPFDQPTRTWGDTWQVAEMAAYSNLILFSVESFKKENFPNYSCVGYRSRNQGFHLEGALVHRFKLAPELFPDTHINTLLKYLEPCIIPSKFGNVKCSFIHASKYKENPFSNVSSPFYYLFELLKQSLKLHNTGLSVSSVNYVLESEVPLCECTFECDHLLYKDKNECILRQSLLSHIPRILNSQSGPVSRAIVFPGLTFNPISEDFSRPPVSCHVLFMGDNAETLFFVYINHVLDVFKETDANVQQAEPNSFEGKSLNKVTISGKTSREISEAVIGEKFLVEVKDSIVSVLVLYLDILGQYVFEAPNWRELWAQGVSVEYRNNVPLLRRVVMFPRIFSLDICLLESTHFNVEDMHDILWQVAGDIIIKVELLNKYQSPEGWRTSCFRIFYQSFDKALCKNTCVSIHQNVIGQVLCSKLGVKVC